MFKLSQKFVKFSLLYRAMNKNKPRILAYKLLKKISKYIACKCVFLALPILHINLYLYDTQKQNYWSGYMTNTHHEKLLHNCV